MTTLTHFLDLLVASGCYPIVPEKRNALESLIRGLFTNSQHRGACCWSIFARWSGEER